MLEDLDELTSQAVAWYWQARTRQSERQRKGRKPDQGLRAAVTGGAQMDGFIALLTELIERAGVSREFVFTSSGVELVVVGKGKLHVSLDFVVKVSKERLGSRLSVPIVDALAARTELTVPGADLEFKTEPQVSMETLVVRLDSLAVTARSLAEELETGDGTLQLLLRDRALYDDLRKTADDVDDLVNDIRENPRKYINLKFELF